MASQTFDGDSIGPQLDLQNESIPPHVGERLATLYGQEEALVTWAEWIEVIRTTSERTTGELPTEDDLCRVDDGEYTVELDGEAASFVCVLDPLAVPFLRSTPGTIRSRTPEDGAEIPIDVEPAGVNVDTDGAVISLGVSREPDVDGTPTHEDVYTESCPYVHAFASVDEYERWASGVDAATTSVPVETGVAIARELARELFET